MLYRINKNIRHPVTRLLIFTLLSLVILRLMAHHLEWGWHFAAALSFGLVGILFAFAFILEDHFLKKILLFAIAAGFTELFADWWLVDITGTLEYAKDSIFLWRSPVYMPFAWTMILVNIGYLAFRLSYREGKWKTIVLSGIIGGTIIPLFEHWAKGAGWWQYVDTPMIGYVPYYIILGEVLICTVLAGFLHMIYRKTYFTAIATGILMGLWIWVSYFISYTILG